MADMTVRTAQDAVGEAIAIAPAQNSPSAPNPQRLDRRESITRDIQSTTGLDEAVLERLVRKFYATAQKDVVIGHLFEGVEDWELHITKITAFWSSVALLTGRYHGQPLATHHPLNLSRTHFRRWLVLFEETAREECTWEGAEYLMGKARLIAKSLEMGVAAARGELTFLVDEVP